MNSYHKKKRRKKAEIVAINKKSTSFSAIYFFLHVYLYGKILKLNFNLIFMKKINLLLILSLFIFITACGGGGMSKDTLTGTKWTVDVEGVEKEMNRIVSKIGDEKMKKEAEQGKEQLNMFKGMIEAVKLEFKENGTMGISGMEALGVSEEKASDIGVKWSLNGDKLSIEGEGQTVNFKVSGSSSSMTLTLTQEEMKALSKKSGEEIPKDVEKEMQAMGDVKLTFKAAK